MTCDMFKNNKIVYYNNIILINNCLKRYNFFITYGCGNYR